MKNIFIFLSLLLILTGCAEKESEKVYRNPDFGFSVTYPAAYQAKEIKWVKEATGITLTKGAAQITVQAMPTGTDYAKIPFEMYVREAAIAEIQNFNKLLLIEKFTSDYEIAGYKTFWAVIGHEDTETGEVNEKTVVGPIYYFQPRLKQQLGDQPVKVIMISGYGGAATAEVEGVARSFRYLTTFKALFKKGNHGKLYIVKKDKPFRIELAANPTTGFNWYIDGLDENRFKVGVSGYEPERTGLVGSGGKSYWTITPLKEGLSTIRFLYYRSWEGKGKKVEEFILRVLVRS